MCGMLFDTGFFKELIFGAGLSMGCKTLRGMPGLLLHCQHPLPQPLIITSASLSPPPWTAGFPSILGPIPTFSLLSHKICGAEQALLVQCGGPLGHRIAC